MHVARTTQTFSQDNFVKFVEFCITLAYYTLCCVSVSYLQCVVIATRPFNFFKYSKHPKTGHPKTGFIQKPDKMMSGFRMLLSCLVFEWSTSLDRFIFEEKNVMLGQSRPFENRTIRKPDMSGIRMVTVNIYSGDLNSSHSKFGNILKQLFIC